MRILKTFFRELTTQSNTALSLGTRFIVFRGLNTLRTRNDFIVLKFCPVELPLKWIRHGKERKMKQLEYLHKHKGNESTTYDKGVQNIPEISTITAWMQDNS